MISLLVVIAALLIYVGYRISRDKKEKKELEHAARKWGARPPWNGDPSGEGKG